MSRSRQRHITFDRASQELSNDVPFQIFKTHLRVENFTFVAVNLRRFGRRSTELLALGPVAELQVRVLWCQILRFLFNGDSLALSGRFLTCVIFLHRQIIGRARNRLLLAERVKRRLRARPTTAVASETKFSIFKKI